MPMDPARLTCRRCGAWWIRQGHERSSVPCQRRHLPTLAAPLHPTAGGGREPLPQGTTSGGRQPPPQALPRRSGVLEQGGLAATARARRAMDLMERAAPTSSRRRWMGSAARPRWWRGLVRRPCRPCPLPAAPPRAPPPSRAAFYRLCSPVREGQRRHRWGWDGRREQAPPPVEDEEWRRGRWGERGKPFVEQRERRRG
jgi:hypothetical protein